MSEEKIQTKHPISGKIGRNISKEKYDLMKAAMLTALKSNTLTYLELDDELNQKLRGKFVGNISWYAETVKLDLEARGIIERTDSKPQKYRIK